MEKSLIEILLVGGGIGAIIGVIVFIANKIGFLIKNRDKIFPKIYIWIKRYFAEFIILLGVYIFISNSLDFFHYSGLKGGGLGGIREVSYYYSASTINNIAIGVIIIVLGFLIVKNRKK